MPQKHLIKVVTKRDAQAVHDSLYHHFEVSIEIVLWRQQARLLVTERSRELRSRMRAFADGMVSGIRYMREV